MTYGFVFPLVSVRDTRPAAVQPNPKETGYRLHRKTTASKYDHVEMFKARCNGATWREIAQTYGLKSAAQARVLLLNSRYVKTMPPDQFAKLPQRDVAAL